MCGKGQESVGHVLSECWQRTSADKISSKTHSALKILFLEMAKAHNLVEATPPMFSTAQPKPMYERDQVTAYWNVPVYADQTAVRANRIDARFVDRVS